MTEEDHLLLNDLKRNTQQLFEKYNELEQKNKMLSKQVENLKQEIELMEHEKIELGRSYEQLKVANRILSERDENGEAKQKIDFLIREIDKCIALLNR
ncbi:hypothetical protein SAMN05444285_11156 [Draconibacterium orientale]|uniref:Cell division protein ZapB n=1 Tax=Draconibacterium orientale TaxID=1168034 RepID=X5E3I7_9BACT|nr:hypothetical protein [Draconibacterium orientale]AHW61171.1 hypothetical protein FH5T_20300 [Draconibacterium orientale]SET35567.1 hypothetical protein SAMN05444285_11156 [Draconibacterium orientale]